MTSALDLIQQHPLTLPTTTLAKLKPLLPLSPKDLSKARKSLRKLIARLEHDDPKSQHSLLQTLQRLAPQLQLEPGTKTPIPAWNTSLSPDLQQRQPTSILASAHNSPHPDTNDNSSSRISSPHSRLTRLLLQTSSSTSILITPTLTRITTIHPLHDTITIDIPHTASLQHPQTLLTLASLIQLAATPHDSQTHLLAELISSAKHDTLLLSNSLQPHIRKAFRNLVHAYTQLLDEHPLPHTRSLARNLSNDELHEMLLVLLIRIVFIAFAEHSQLLPTHNPLYQHSYSLTQTHTLLHHPAPAHAWQRLLALFRLLDHGCHHPQLNLIPYGGRLFDSHRFPLLELWELPDATIRSTLQDLLQHPQHHTPISFAHFDIEHIGQLYQGLLEHRITGQPSQRTTEPSPLRRLSGTYYTPPHISKPLVQHAIDTIARQPDRNPLPPRDILKLRIADIAAGSGALLVQATQSLAKLLVESWTLSARQLRNADTPTLPFAEPASSPHDPHLPLDNPQLLETLARRLVVQQCIYASDLNPLATEITRLSLWITSLARDKPFSFIDHAISHGDSLTGLSLEQLRSWSLDPHNPSLPLFQSLFSQHLDHTVSLRKHLASLPDDTPQQRDYKSQLLDHAHQHLLKLRIAADSLTAAQISKPGAAAADELARITSAQTLQDWQDIARHTQSLLDHQPLHFPLEFPEVFLDHPNPGFDLILANPPFLGGQRISQTLGHPYRNFITRHIAPNSTGSADLSAYFLKRALSLLAHNGTLAILTTSNIQHGASRRIALDDLQHAHIIRAETHIPWPGDANVNISALHIHKGPWPHPRILNGQPTPLISSSLTPHSLPKPQTLTTNLHIAFQGSIPLGKGFIVDPHTVTRWIQREPHNHQVLLPYLSGQELHHNPTLTPSRWIIDMRQRSRDQAARFPLPFAHLHEHVRPQRQLARRRRDQTHWWQHHEKRPGLYRAIADLPHVLVRARIANTHIIHLAPTHFAFSDGVVVFALHDLADLSILQSRIHELWARAHSGSLRGDLRYAITRAFETFPRPLLTRRQAADLRDAAEQLLNLRRSSMAERKLGLQPIHKLAADPSKTDQDLQALRDTLRLIDVLTLEAYGWADLDPQRDSQTILQRLHNLNHIRAADSSQDRASAQELPDRELPLFRAS